MTTEWMTGREVQDHLRMSQTSLYRLRRGGLLIAHQVRAGGRNLYRREDVDGLLRPNKLGDSARVDRVGRSAQK